MSRATKPGHICLLIRNIPKPLHQEMKKLAESRGLTIKALVLETMRRETENADKG